MADQPGPSGSKPDQDKKREERMAKLRQLHQKRIEASRINHQEVVEEYKRNNLPANFAKKREWAEYKRDDDERRAEAQAEGLDYDRIKLLDVQADDAERSDKRKQAKKNTDPGFSGFEAATQRQYQRCVKGLKPDFEEYERMKEEMGEEAFYAGKDTIIQGRHKDSKEAVDRMVDDLNKQIAKRDKFSRRRRYNEDDTIDFINERNMKFNKKLERFYGQYTSEIKQNLERGTAV